MTKSLGRLDWKKAPDVKKKVNHLIKNLQVDWIRASQVHCFRSEGSKARAYARIWGLSRIWQLALNEKPAYVIEVISEKYDSLPEKKKTEVLLHEIAHIPTTFSGALLPHFKRGKRSFHKKVHDLIKSYNRTSKKT